MGRRLYYGAGLWVPVALPSRQGYVWARIPAHPGLVPVTAESLRRDSMRGGGRLVSRLAALALSLPDRGCFVGPAQYAASGWGPGWGHTFDPLIDIQIWTEWRYLDAFASFAYLALPPYRPANTARGRAG